MVTNWQFIVCLYHSDSSLFTEATIKSLTCMESYWWGHTNNLCEMQHVHLRASKANLYICILWLVQPTREILMHLIYHISMRHFAIQSEFKLTNKVCIFSRKLLGLLCACAMHFRRKPEVVECACVEIKSWNIQSDSLHRNLKIWMRLCPCNNDE